jgi:hypothetical protein
MDYTNIIIAICTVATTVASLLLLLGRKFNKIDEEFKNLRREMNEEFKNIRLDLRGIDSRLSRIEGKEDFSKTVILELYKEKKGIPNGTVDSH